jgi:urease accessory protein
MRKSLLVLPMLVLAPAAHAHTVDDGGGLLSAMLHPLTGIDHLLAMVMVGLWATLLAREEPKSSWLVPVTFLAAMAAGAALAVAGVSLPAYERAITGSVVVLGLILLAMMRVTLPVAMVLTGAFALVHGFAHGTELPLGISPLQTTTGMLLASAALHATGVMAGTVLLRRRATLALQVFGALAALAGLGLAAAA